MEIIYEHVDLIIIVSGALVGSIKASVEFDKDKHCVARAIDIFLGVFCGVMLARHFHNVGSTALGGLLALVGGVSGAVVVEVFMQMLPSIAKEAIKNVVGKNLK